MIDLYAVLGLHKNATAKSIKKAYRSKARDFHPDRNHEEGARGRFEEIKLAFDVLSDPKRRKVYDETGQYEHTEPNNEQSELAQLLLQTFAKVLQGLLMTNKDPNKVNILDLMRNNLKENTDQITEHREAFVKPKKQMEEMLTRIEDGDLLQDVIQNEIRKLGLIIDDADRKIEANKNATKYLKKVKYRIDKEEKSPVSEAERLRSMLPHYTPSSSTTFFFRGGIG